MTDTNPETDARTLKITVGQSEQLLDAASQRIQQAQESEDFTTLYQLNFDSVESISQLTRPTNLTLLRVIRQENPASISEAARLVDRDYKEVHRNISELEALGLVEFEDCGRSKKPVVLYDSLEIEIPLTEELGAEPERESVSA